MRQCYDPADLVQRRAARFRSTRHRLPPLSRHHPLLSSRLVDLSPFPPRLVCQGETIVLAACLTSAELTPPTERRCFRARARRFEEDCSISLGCLRGVSSPSCTCRQGLVSRPHPSQHGPSRCNFHVLDSGLGHPAQEISRDAEGVQKRTVQAGVRWRQETSWELFAEHGHACRAGDGQYDG